MYWQVPESNTDFVSSVDKKQAAMAMVLHGLAGRGQGVVGVTLQVGVGLKLGLQRWCSCDCSVSSGEGWGLGQAFAEHERWHNTHSECTDINGSTHRGGWGGTAFAEGSPARHMNNSFMKDRKERTARCTGGSWSAPTRGTTVVCTLQCFPSQQPPVEKIGWMHYKIVQLI